MKCILAPEAKAVLNFTFVIVPATIFGIAVFGLIVYGLSFMVGTTLAYLESFELMANLTASSTMDNYNEFLIKSGFELIGKSFVILLLTVLSIGMLIGSCMELSEHYTYRKHNLEYKFEGKKLPWYRVLLSYIIVCEPNKKDNT